MTTETEEQVKETFRRILKNILIGNTDYFPKPDFKWEEIKSYRANRFSERTIGPVHMWATIYSYCITLKDGSYKYIRYESSRSYL